MKKKDIKDEYKLGEELGRLAVKINIYTDIFFWIWKSFYHLFRCFLFCRRISGKFGIVYRCSEKRTAKQLAAKFIMIQSKVDRENVEREVSIMGMLQNSKILQLYDAFDDGKNQMCMIMELYVQRDRPTQVSPLSNLTNVINRSF